MIRPILNARLDGASTIPATGTLTAASGSTVDLSLATVTLPASITSTFFDFKGNQSASGNPNYPTGSKGDVYYISVAGKVGGAVGKTVTVGDMLICSADNAGGTEASVGTSWFVTESNLDMTNVAITGGTITGTTVSGITFSGSGSLANSGTSSLTGFTGSGTSSGTNTGDQTSVTGNAGTATALATARNIFNISFNGTANVAGDATNTGHFASIPGTGAAGHFVTENGTAPTLIAGRSAWYSDGSGVPSFKNGTGTAVTLVRSSDIGVSVQAYDADLTTWAGITPGANVGTFLATPSGANLAAALTSALPVSKGGTGQTVAGTAFSNLGMDATAAFVTDEFFGGQDGTPGNIGDLNWFYANVVGSGTVRMSGDNTVFGAAAIITGTTRRNCVSMYFKSNGATGAQCLTTGSLNSTFVLLWRFKLTATTQSAHLGIGARDEANPGRFVGVRAVPASAEWTTLTAVSVGEYRRPTSANGRRYYASTGGTTAVSEPTWPTTPGGTVADGTVVWTENGQDGNANFVFEARDTASADETAAATSVSSVAVDTNYHTMKLRWDGTNWLLSLDGGAESTLTKTMGGSFTPLAVCQTESAAAGQLNLDLFRMSVTGLSR